jgi:hypothetical protein
VRSYVIYKSLAIYIYDFKAVNSLITANPAEAL